ncbi:hypothetical protein DRE_04778 [Drechslerella stenobrocha 248]|uniref:Nucleotide exchange factor SIL1 n=1 Tax=Drechslerella stenobrocha 248 TaxID=1043628 RepID=W7IAB7_9PEZI|nr:hypothetical protein DRE_04778 [Drechslerella stenobrocha 248]
MHGLNRITALAVWLLCLFFHGAFTAHADAAPDRAGSAGEVEMICHPGRTCYPKVFVPTTTFLPVESDQVVPAGLHIRLNLGTGGREAKFIDPADDEGAAVYVDTDKKLDLSATGPDHSDLVVVPDEDTRNEEASIRNGGRGNETDSPRVQVVPPPADEETLKPNPHLSTTDREAFNAAASVLAEKSPSQSALTDALQKLSDVSHEPEYGVKLVETSLHRLIGIISSSSYAPAMRSSAAITLGNSLQNNAVALSRVKKLLGGETKEVILKPLLDALIDETDMVLTRRLMFALSKAVRVHHGKRDVISLDGLAVLEIVYIRTKDLTLRGKIVAFLQDEFLDADMMEPEVAEGGTGGRGSQKIIKGEDNLSGWCEVLQKDLIGRSNTEGKGDLDSQTKVLETLKALKQKYGDNCKAREGLREWLAAELERVGSDEGDNEWIQVPLEDVNNGFFH